MTITIEDLKLPENFNPDAFRALASRHFNSGGANVSRHGKILKDPNTLISSIDISYEAPNINQATDQASNCSCRIQYCSGTDAGCGLDRPIREMNVQLSQGNWVEAYFLFGMNSPFTEFLGSACAHHCEFACIHAAGDNQKDGVQINFNEYTLGYLGQKHGLLPYLFDISEEKNGKTIGIVGSGPAGLQAAWKAAWEGFSEIHIFEKNGPKINSNEALNDPKKMQELVSYIGGQFRNIPSWKCDDSKLNEIVELMIRKQNIIFHTGVEVGSPDYPAQKFEKDFDFKILAPGVGLQPTKLNIPGEEYVIPALDYRNAQYRASIGHKPSENFDFSKNPMYMGNEKVVAIAGGLTGDDVIETVAKEQNYAKITTGKSGELIALMRNLKPGESPSIDIRHPGLPDNKVKTTSYIVSKLAGTKKEYQQYIKEIVKQENNKFTIVVGHRELEEEWQSQVKKENRKWKKSEIPDYKIEDATKIISAAGYERFATHPTKLAHDFNLVDNNGVVNTLKGRTEKENVFIIGDAGTSLIGEERWFLHEALGTGNRVVDNILSDIRSQGIFTKNHENRNTALPEIGSRN